MLKRNVISIVIALLIMYVSLTGSDSFDRFSYIDIPFLDKIVHTTMYFTLMLSLLFENRLLRNELRKQISLSVIVLVYGGIIELLQQYLTTSRYGDLKDLAFNLLGIIIALCVWPPIRYLLGKWIR